MEKYQVEGMRLGSREVFPFVIEADEGEASEDIVLTVRVDGREFTASNYGYFQAFQELRDLLLKAGIGLRCEGARLNAVQSAMAGGTEKIYLVTKGEPARMKDTRSLYEHAELSDFPDTRELTAFYLDWAESLKCE